MTTEVVADDEKAFLLKPKRKERGKKGEKRWIRKTNKKKNEPQQTAGTFLVAKLKAPSQSCVNFPRGERHSVAAWIWA